MFDGNTDRPGIEEQYFLSGTMTNDEGRGPGHLRLAAGLVARDDAGRPKVVDRPSVRIGHLLAILQQDWHGTVKPVRRMPRTIREWIAELPLVKSGERLVRGQAMPILTRDKDGARQQHDEERARLDALYEQELLQLAQRLPSRVAVREALFALALRWGWEEANEKVSAVLRFFLDDNCTTCHGTGEVMAGEKVRTCPDCEGRTKGAVPYGGEGHRMLDFMGKCRSHWVGSLKQMSRAIHLGS
jgi:hypothetical protein